jgi:hypothetical protein
MKNFINFITPTVINPLSWEIMAMNSKPNSNSPIGMFGTGLKYAIAICVSRNWPITIVNNNNGLIETYKFTSKKIDFRGEEKSLVMCNDKQMPYTTDLGKHWDDWTVMRELHSNTVDENGRTIVSDAPVSADEGSSVVTIESEEIAACMANIGEYILNEESYVVEEDCPEFEMLSDKHSAKWFYRGIFVGAAEEFTYGYNLKTKTQLTEDRTLKSQWSVMWDIGRAIAKSANVSLITKFLTAEGKERECSFPEIHDWCDVFKETATNLFNENPHKMNKEVASMLLKSKKYQFEVLEPSIHEKIMIANAVAKIKSAGINTCDKIKKVRCIDSKLIAFALNGEVNLTESAFASGEDYLTSTLIEEFAHIDGYVDEDRRYEQYLCNHIARLVHNQYIIIQHQQSI